MFFLEAKDKIQNVPDETLKEEIESGTIFIQQQQQQQQSQPTSSKTLKSGRNKKTNKK